MSGPTHAITGLATAVLIGRLTPVSPDAIDLLTIICGVLAPDVGGNGVITRPGTILRRLLGRTLGNLIDLVFGLLVGVVHILFSHRGFLHSPFLALCLLAVGIVGEIDWLVWFSIGYTVHLIADAFTFSGNPNLSPFSKRHVSYSSMRTGAPIEFLFAGVVLFFSCLCGWILLPDGVRQSHIELYEMTSRASMKSLRQETNESTRDWE